MPKYTFFAETDNWEVETYEDQFKGDEEYLEVSFGKAYLFAEKLNIITHGSAHISLNKREAKRLRKQLKRFLKEE